METVNEKLDKYCTIYLRSNWITYSGESSVLKAVLFLYDYVAITEEGCSKSKDSDPTAKSCRCDCKYVPYHSGIYRVSIVHLM